MAYHPKCISSSTQVTAIFFSSWQTLGMSVLAVYRVFTSNIFLQFYSFSAEVEEPDALQHCCHGSGEDHGAVTTETTIDNCCHSNNTTSTAVDDPCKRVVQNGASHSASVPIVNIITPGDGLIHETQQKTSLLGVATNNVIESKLEDERCFQRTAKGLTLCISYAANVGGVATLTGAMPNMIMKEHADM